MATPLMSLATVMKTYENWLHFGTFVHEPLKASLRGVLHNTTGDVSYIGLPTNPTDLYIELQKHRYKLNKLVQNRVINNDQMILIFPPNKQETDSEKFDVTLLVVLIINCTNLTPPAKGWKEKKPADTDTSKAANVVRARELRNFFHHTEPKDFDKAMFDTKWTEGDIIVNALGYSYDSHALRTASLDPTRISTVFSLVKYLQIEQNSLKKQINSSHAEQEFKKNAAVQLQHITKLEMELLGACKKIDGLKEQSDTLKKHILVLQNQQNQQSETGMCKYILLVCVSNACQDKIYTTCD